MQLIYFLVMLAVSFYCRFEAAENELVKFIVCLA